jgi:glycosyl transferase family 43
MSIDRPLLFVTPTYPRPRRLSFLRRCAEDFRGVPNLLWLIVEDDARLAPEVERLLAESGVAHLYAAHGPTRCWGNAQRNWALKYIRDNRLSGVVYLADDDNKYEAPLFDELRKVQRIGILPVGRMGPWGIERPIVRGGRIVRWSADWKRRTYPVDMAGFAFNAELLSNTTGELWTYPGRGGESEFIEILIRSPDELEFLCNDCRACYVWHDLPLGWSPRLGLASYRVHRRIPVFIRRKAYRLFNRLGLRR